MLRHGLIPLLMLLLAATPQVAQPPGKKSGDSGSEKEKKGQVQKEPPTSRDLLRWLEESLDVTGYQTERSLKEVLKQFADAFTAKGKELALFVDEPAFREENPDAPNVYDSEVKFRPFPRRLTFRDALTFALSKVPTKNATFLVRRGCLEITTQERAAPHRLLQERITANFDKRPLAEALDELSDMTGATLVLDPRVGDKARTPITVVFRNSISLEAAVRLLAEMAGLHARLDENDVFFITGSDKDGNREKKTDLRLRDRPFYLALKDLASWSCTSIILDPRAETEQSDERFRPPQPLSAFPVPLTLGEIPVSATFKAGTSPRAAAMMLAAMVGLEAVVIDDAVFVTTRKMAAQLRANLKERPANGNSRK